MTENKDRSRTPSAPPVHDQKNQGGERNREENPEKTGGQRGQKGQPERGAGQRPDKDETGGRDRSSTE